MSLSLFLCLSFFISYSVSLSHSPSLSLTLSFTLLSLTRTHSLFYPFSLSLFISPFTHLRTYILSLSLFHSLTHPFSYSPIPIWNLEFLDHVGFSQWSQYPDEEFNLADDSKWEVRNLSSIAILYFLFVSTFLLILSNFTQNRNFTC